MRARFKRQHDEIKARLDSVVFRLQVWHDTHYTNSHRVVLGLTTQKLNRDALGYQLRTRNLQWILIAAGRVGKYEEFPAITFSIVNPETAQVDFNRLFNEFLILLDALSICETPSGKHAMKHRRVKITMQELNDCFSDSSLAIVYTPTQGAPIDA